MDEAVIQALGGPDSAIFASPIEDHLRALAEERDLPDQAVMICVVRAAEAAPALRAILAKAADGADLDEPESNLLFRGVHILGGMRDTAAWPMLVRFLRRSPEDLHDLLGDALTENLSQIAASLFDGDVDSLFDLAIDPDVDDFVREALFGTATFLTWDGRIERSRMQNFLLRFWEQSPPDFDFAWMGWLEAIALLGFTDLVSVAQQAFDENRIDDSVYDRKDFERELAKGPASPDDTDRLRQEGFGYLDDVLDALEGFTAPDDSRTEDYASVLDALENGPEPVRNPWRNVGRNDPCPCGSGKKAKKCCLAAQG